MKRCFFVYIFLLGTPVSVVAQNTEGALTQMAEPASLKGIGRIICRILDDSLSCQLFSNYWVGNGDIKLSEEQFSDIEIYIKELQLLNGKAKDSLQQEGELWRESISFYGTKYAKAFGVATVYTDATDSIVGFEDYYDFDAQKWGTRPYNWELLVRIVSLLSPRTALPFKISYGNIFEVIGH